MLASLKRGGQTHGLIQILTELIYKQKTSEEVFYCAYAYGWVSVTKLEPFWF
jgi:hypothetical protein